MTEPAWKSNGHVLLEGDGMAAVCTARLLSDAGVPYLRTGQPRGKLASILMGEQTQQLLSSLFPAEEARDIFRGFPHVRQRIVLWGDAAAPVTLPHSGVVVFEEELLQRLWHCVGSSRSLVAPEEKPAWQVQTSAGTLLPEAIEQIGTNTASIARATLVPSAAPESCWVESVEEGWLFLLATGSGTATLIAVGGALESMLAASRLVRRQVAHVDLVIRSVPSSPRLLRDLAAAGLLACGSAAIGFDPLCGEGAGNAVREAFLAAAVVRAALSGQSAEALCAHYSSRLRAGFLRHLQVCLSFYASGGTGAFWQAQTVALQAGIASLQADLKTQPGAHFRLLDRDLVPLHPHATRGTSSA